MKHAEALSDEELTILKELMETVEKHPLETGKLSISKMTRILINSHVNY